MDYVLDVLDPDTEIICESKADDTYTVVSAASIVAKYTRDKILADWVYREQKIALNQILCPIDSNIRFSKAFGNGYPGHVEARKWLKLSFDPVYGYPTIVRFSWSTTQKLLVNDKGKDLVYWFDLADEEALNQVGSKNNN